MQETLIVSENFKDSPRALGLRGRIRRGLGNTAFVLVSN